MMRWIKKSWFPVSATLLIAMIGFNLYTLARLQLSDRETTSPDVTAQRAMTQGSATRGSAARTSPAVEEPALEELVAAPGPRSIELPVAARQAGDSLETAKLAEALEGESVRQVRLDESDGKTLRLTFHAPLKLSEITNRLDAHGATLVEDRLPLREALRLRVSGMTCQGCASALREELSGLDGVEVKGVDLRSVEEGYAYVSVAEGKPLSLAKLKQAIKRTPFELDDVEWPASAEGASSE